MANFMSVAKGRSDFIPRGAPLAVDQFVGFGVTNELFFGGVPFQGATELIADVAELADGGGTGASLDIRYRTFS
jgi:hypothetical protein